MRKVIPVIVVLAALAALGSAAFFLQLGHRTVGQLFDSGGVQIHYTVEGEGEPVVLVHGFAVNADMNWRRPGITKKLAARYKVISMDTRGHGWSGKPTEPEQYGANMAEDIVRLLDHLGIEKAHVVGYSLGGFITMKLLTEHPERLLSAAPCAAGWARVDDKRELLAELATSLEEGRGFMPLARHLEPEGKEPAWFKVALMNLTLGYLNDEAALANVMRGATGLAVTEESLRANTVPVLSLVGSKDPLKQGIDAMTGVLAHHEAVIIDGADHITALGCPEMADSLLAFLAKHGEGKP